MTKSNEGFACLPESWPIDEEGGEGGGGREGGDGRPQGDPKGGEPLLVVGEEGAGAGQEAIGNASHAQTGGSVVPAIRGAKADERRPALALTRPRGGASRKAVQLASWPAFSAFATFGCGSDEFDFHIRNAHSWELLSRIGRDGSGSGQSAIAGVHAQILGISVVWELIALHPLRPSETVFAHEGGAPGFRPQTNGLAGRNGSRVVLDADGRIDGAEEETHVRGALDLHQRPGKELQIRQRRII